ncbi:hypothetical protein B488_09940 [Liberibacter crescens BT-1]|uniref:Uncharacterized protein n=1 Tax=Liberibacter crescens (strain BT-1) TaxID=1215343 RepID=L0EX91_LIBCB|nr:hypothetical protein [Liberibacter crescens]AGA64986.1 hypothetical protein B488_09940 [Liberibacter crescens BT-1]AMC13004.1 hypothetical protein RL73_05055 [Liberibacter crescens]
MDIHDVDDKQKEKDTFPCVKRKHINAHKDRKERLASMLRKNLIRRKEQLRARAADVNKTYNIQDKE